MGLQGPRSGEYLSKRERPYAITSFRSLSALEPLLDLPVYAGPNLGLPAPGTRVRACGRGLRTLSTWSEDCRGPRPELVTPLPSATQMLSDAPIMGNRCELDRP